MNTTHEYGYEPARPFLYAATLLQLNNHLHHFGTDTYTDADADPDSDPDADLKPFMCPEPGCFLRFRRKFTLTEHLKTHTGEKPFTCPVVACGKTFTTSGNLARHKRLHPWLKPQACLVAGCDKSFANEAKLERHIKTHFKGPRVLYPCRAPGCSKHFTTTGNVTRHMKQQHRGVLATIVRAQKLESHRETSFGDVDLSQTCLAGTMSYDRSRFDPSRAFNPLMDEVSDVRDEELMATLQCLF